jgi:hypothetical protein
MGAKQVAKRKTLEKIHTNLREHPSVAAWNKLQPQRVEPKEIDIVKRGKKTNVYRLTGVGPQGSDVVAKRCRQDKALVERVIYERVLPHLPTRTLRYYGCLADAEDDCSWLFLEDAGTETYSPYIEEQRMLAARWLGLLHLTASRLPIQRLLPDRGPGFYLEELRSTRDTILQNLASPALQADDVAVLQAIVSQYNVLESRWRQVEALCNRMPQTLVHGDFTERNVHFRRLEDNAVLLPFDWEVTGWGTPAVDIAQLIRFRKLEQGAVYVPFTPERADWSTPAIDLGQFIDRSVSTQIAAYLSVVRPCWPWLDVQDLKQLAAIGTIFRLINSITWEQSGIVFDLWESHGLGHKYAKWTIVKLQAYRARLDSAIQAVHWEDESLLRG